MTLDKLIFLFFGFSVFGWCMEFVFRSIYEKRIFNPGFHKGPYLPIYGIAAVTIILVYSRLAYYPLYIRCVFYVVCCTLIEFLAGFVLDRFFGKRYWNYDDSPFNIMGYVCIHYSFGWLAICIFAEKLIFPAAFEIIDSMPYILIQRIDIVMIVVFTVDFLYSSGIAGSTIGNRLKLFLDRRER